MCNSQSTSQDSCAIRFLAVIAIALTIPTAAHAQAQTARVFDACFVPTVGAIYLIGETGLPADCLSPVHERIKWSEGSNGAVTLLDGSVTTPKLADDAVTAAKIADDAVGGSQIANDAVQTDDVVDAAITADKLALGAVGSDQLADGAVTADKIAAGAVVITEIAVDAVGREQIRSSAVGSDELAARSVGPEHLNLRWVRLGGTPLTVNASSTRTIPRKCNDGREMMAGGWLTDGDLTVLQSGPNSNTDWTFEFRNDTTADIDVETFVICVDLQ